MDIEFKCPFCGSLNKIDSCCLEDSIYSDPHNPDVDYLICSCCSRLISITDSDFVYNRNIGDTLSKGFSVTLDGSLGYIVSDTFNVFLIKDGEILPI